MSKPIRIQRKRTKGYKMPPNTVSVTRPGNFGNPFRVEDEKQEECRQLKKFGLHTSLQVELAARSRVVEKFRDMMLDLNSHEVSPKTRAHFRFMRDRIRDLEGKNLACYCGLQDQCHADVLLELANPNSENTNDNI